MNFVEKLQKKMDNQNSRSLKNVLHFVMAPNNPMSSPNLYMFYRFISIFEFSFA